MHDPETWNRPKAVSIPGTISYWNPYRQLPGFLPATRLGLAEYICAMMEQELDTDSEWFQTASDFDLIRSAVELTLRSEAYARNSRDVEMMREN